MVDILDTEGEVTAKARCELVVDALSLGLDEWTGMLREVEPVTALSEGDHCQLCLPNGGQGEIVVSHAFPRSGGVGAVYEFVGMGAPPEIPPEAAS